MTKDTEVTKLSVEEDIQNKIYIIREEKVMLDFDLAKLYKVETKVLNQAVKRNIQRFPPDFMFKLNKEESRNLRSQIVTSSYGGTRWSILKLYFKQYNSSLLKKNYRDIR